jgi:hypothetical protein
LLERKKNRNSGRGIVSERKRGREGGGKAGRKKKKTWREREIGRAVVLTQHKLAFSFDDYTPIGGA